MFANKNDMSQNEENVPFKSICQSFRSMSVKPSEEDSDSADSDVEFSDIDDRDL